jgi:HAD superfamily hydrolase (TIGR01509 family)
VIFDMDGLMFDSERMAQHAWQQAARESGYDMSDDIFRVVVGRSLPAVEEELIKALGVDFPLKTVYQRKRVLLEEEIMGKGLPLKRGLLELLELIEQLGLQAAIASSSPCDVIIRNLEAAGLPLECFGAIVGGNEVQHGKPAPDIFLAAARALGALPERCLVLEDSNPGVQAAYAAGMLPVMVPDVVPPTKRSRSLAYRVVPSLERVVELLGG